MVVCYMTRVRATYYILYYGLPLKPLPWTSIPLFTLIDTHIVICCCFEIFLSRYVLINDNLTPLAESLRNLQEEVYLHAKKWLNALPMPVRVSQSCIYLPSTPFCVVLRTKSVFCCFALYQFKCVPPSSKLIQQLVWVKQHL